MSRTPSSRPLLLATAFAAVLPACGGGQGDQPSKPAADEFGTCARLAGTIGEASWEKLDDAMSTSCKLPPDRSVCISGVTIVAIDRFDETKDGKSSGNFYIEDGATADDPADFSGVTVFRPSFSPPDLRLAEGDVADFTGTYQEFGGPSTFVFPYCRTLPELSGTMSFRFDNNLPLVPHNIKSDDLKSYVSARKHIGTLVRVEGLTLAAAGKFDSSKHRWTAAIAVSGSIEQTDQPSVSNELFDIDAAITAKTAPPFNAGTTFKAITGVITYFGGFHLAPRSPADIEP
ncbi:MAG: hypothetical protein U0359_14245 [Byssovorax sp.]